MAVNKNFVVKNGFEVNTDLIVADATTNKVGIGTTIPAYTLSVIGGIGATDSFTSGVSTIRNELRVGVGGTVFTVIADPIGAGQSVGVGTAHPRYLLDVRSPVSTGQTALYVQGDVRVTGDLNIDDIVLDQANIARLYVSDSVDINPGTLYAVGLSTFQDYADFNNSVDIAIDLNVVGLTTIGGYVDINNSVDISNGLNVVGVTTLATVDINAGDIEVSNVDTTDLNVTGIATIATVDINAGDIEVSNVDTTDLNVIGISTLGTVLVSSGIVTATSVSGIVTYYGDGSYLTGNARNLTATIGIGTSSGPVGYGVSFLDLRGPGLSTVFYNNDVGIATIFFEGGGSGTASIGIGSTPGEAFVGIITAGNLWYNTNIGRLFIYYQDVDSAQWVDAAPFNIGIDATLVGVAFSAASAISPSLYFAGDVQTGFFSPTPGQFTIVSAASSILNVNADGVNITGVVTATSFIGDGSGLTGAGSTVFNDTTTNQEFFPLFTSTTSGTITASGISTSKLTYNPFNGEMTAINFNSTSDQNLKTNIQTVENALEIVNNLRGVSFEWKENGNKSYGVIAQELEKVLPELVRGDDPKTVSYSGIIGVLIEAIKELRDEVQQLKTEINK